MANENQRKKDLWVVNLSSEDKEKVLIIKGLKKSLGITQNITGTVQDAITKNLLYWQKEAREKNLQEV